MLPIPHCSGNALGVGYVVDANPLNPATAKVSLLDYGVSTALYYVHADHLGTPRQLTTSTAANTTVWRWSGEPFGSALADSDPDQNGSAVRFNLRFPGQYFDAETKLHYNYFRDYDPNLGRYIESDPIGLKGGLNTYGYVGGNPVGAVDALGLQTTTLGNIGRGALTGGTRGRWGGLPGMVGGALLGALLSSAANDDTDDGCSDDDPCMEWYESMLALWNEMNIGLVESSELTQAAYNRAADNYHRHCIGYPRLPIFTLR